MARISGVDLPREKRVKNAVCTCSTDTVDIS